MLRRPKKFPLYLLNRLILRQQLRMQSGRGRHAFRDKNDDDDDEKIRTKKENQEGYVHLMKSRGQHLLTNQRILDSIVRKSDIKSTDTVLEIGPGTGNLTLKLLEAAEKVVAVELDKRMVEVLFKRVSDRGLEDKLSVICKDALKTEFPRFDLVVANIPYGISSPLVAKLVFGAIPFRSATLLLQKEFARRLLAKPGDSEFNRLAVNVKLVAEVEFVMDVSKRDFVPCPKVDSSVVIIRPKAEIPDVDLSEWLAFTRTCFSKKNKTLGATFKQKKKVTELLRISTGMDSKEKSVLDGCNYSEEGGEEEVSDEEENCSFSGSDMGMSLFREKVVTVLKLGGFEEKRPSKLCNEELLHLLYLLNQAGIYFHDQAKSTDSRNEAFAAAYSP